PHPVGPQKPLDTLVPWRTPTSTASSVNPNTSLLNVNRLSTAHFGEDVEGAVQSPCPVLVTSTGNSNKSPARTGLEPSPEPLVHERSTSTSGYRSPTATLPDAAFVTTPTSPRDASFASPNTL